MGNRFFGARWWRFDIHAHSPASYDYGKGTCQQALKNRLPRNWLLDFMRAKIDCVAITDHNSAGWIGNLGAAYNSLHEERPDGFRELNLFPSVEVTVHGGSHLLAIFDPATTEHDIVAFLGKIGLPPDSPDPSEQCTEQSFLQVVRAVSEAGGLAIPAHADGQKGVLTAYSGETLRQILVSDRIIAAEMDDPSKLRSGPAAHHRVTWTPVLGSDSHHPSGRGEQSFPGSSFTWVKMGKPSLEGLRLALLDRASRSVMRSVDAPQDPNRPPAIMIEGISVTNAKYAGQRNPLQTPFSPWMTAIIGGRGTGKSTLVEMMRLCLRRDRELPRELRDELGRFAKVPRFRTDSGALTTSTSVTVDIRKDGQRFRSIWHQDGRGPAVERESADGTWSPTPGDVRSRFPVRIFSQKQILALASDPTSLLHLIDEAEAVGGLGLKARIDEIETKYLRLRSEIRELESRLAGRARIQGALEDLTARISVFERGDHRNVLVAYRRLSRQIAVTKRRREEISETVRQIRDLADQADPADIRQQDFDEADPLEAQALQWLARAAQAQCESSTELRGTADKLEGFAQTWKNQFAPAFRAHAQRIKESYDGLREALANEGIGDPQEYGSLIQRRQVLGSQLSALNQLKDQVALLRQQASEGLAEMEALRIKRCGKRQTFLNTVLAGNPNVRISVIPFGTDPMAQEPRFRKALAREDGLERDILSSDGQTGVLSSLYQGLPDNPDDQRTREVAGRISTLKARIVAARAGRTDDIFGKWFCNHIRNLAPEQLDRLQLWQPTDSLRIEFRRPHESVWTPIHSGSPGQKSAALLAFLLSSGEEPIILDQPEDDLDNNLVYDLIVRQIRTCKTKRQVIVVTHNANIVVNGAAERIVTMDFLKGQCMVVNTGSGCLQEHGVREQVWSVMEGGKEAFDGRYKRLVTEVRDAR